MDNKIIKNSLSQVGILSRIILQFYARNRSHFVNIAKIAAIAWTVTVSINVRYIDFAQFMQLTNRLFREYMKLIWVL